MIDPEILEQFGASRKSLAKGETLFAEGGPAEFYYQVMEGEIRMINLIEDGTEYIQGIFHPGQSFGEPPLFGIFPYPASAIASQPTTVYKLPYRALLDLLRLHFEVHCRLTATLSRRLHYKSTQAKEMSSYNAEHQLLTLLRYLKEQAGSPLEYQITLTRQELAAMTGLRVETVIRTIKQLAQTGKLSVQQGKIVI